MGRKTYRTRKPQAPKDPMARARAAEAAIASLPDRATITGLGADKQTRGPKQALPAHARRDDSGEWVAVPVSRPAAPVYGSGKKKGVTGGRGAVRPPGTAKVAPYIDESRIRPSAAHDGFHGAGKDPNPPRTTFVRSRKGGVSSASVRPHAPADACPFCWHEEAKLASIGDRPMGPVKLLRHCRDHYPAKVREVVTEREDHVLADATLKVAWREKVKNHADELGRPAGPPPVPAKPSMLDGATADDIAEWESEHGDAYREAGDWRKRYSA